MTTESRISEKRSSRLQKNILVSFIAKGWSAIIVLLMVPITLKCLGEYNNGVWLTISSVMLWIDNLDIGLGYGQYRPFPGAFRRSQDSQLEAHCRLAERLSYGCRTAHDCRIGSFDRRTLTKNF